MNDLFQGDPLYIAMMERIEALEAIVYAGPKVGRTKAEEPLNEAWQIWNRHRSGKGWTAKARELSMRELRKLAGEDGTKAMAIVEQSIMNGWRGLFELRQQNSFTPSSGAHGSALTKYKTAAETLIPTETKEQRDAAYLAQQRIYGFIE